MGTGSRYRQIGACALDMGAFLLPVMPFGHATLANPEDCAGIEATDSAMILEPGLEAAALEVHQREFQAVGVFGVEECGKAVEFGAAVVQVAHVLDSARPGAEAVEVSEVLTHCIGELLLGAAHAGHPSMTSAER